MSIGVYRSLWIGILSFGFLTSVALADPAKDLELGEAAFNREDLSAAMEFFTKAAKAGYAPAQVRLGELLDISEYNRDAVEWYRKAAEQGDASGEYHLGHMYATGEGVVRSDEKALYWFNLSVAKDYPLALRTLAQAYRKGELGLTIDLDKAKLLDDRAAILDAAEKRAEAKQAAEKAKKGAEK
jgi:tetratricopeptide (TPR) repeat protein